MKKPYFKIDGYVVGLSYVNIGRDDDNFMRLSTNHTGIWNRIQELGIQNGSRENLTILLEKLAIESGQEFIPVDVCVVCGSLGPRPEWIMINSKLVCSVQCKYNL